MDREPGRVTPRLGGAPRTGAGTITIVHTGASFRLSRESWIKGQPNHTEFRVVIDGGAHAMEAGGRTIHFRGTWTDGGEALAVEMRIVDAAGESRNVVTYRLRSAGARLEAQESFRGPALEYTNTWVLDRSV